jgi:hypothetical protein
MLPVCATFVASTAQAPFLVVLPVHPPSTHSAGGFNCPPLPSHEIKRHGYRLIARPDGLRVWRLQARLGAATAPNRVSGSTSRSPRTGRLFSLTLSRGLRDEVVRTHQFGGCPHQGPQSRPPLLCVASASKIATSDPGQMTFSPMCRLQRFKQIFHLRATFRPTECLIGHA